MKSNGRRKNREERAKVSVNNGQVNTWANSQLLITDDNDSCLLSSLPTCLLFIVPVTAVRYPSITFVLLALGWVERSVGGPGPDVRHHGGWRRGTVARSGVLRSSPSRRVTVILLA